MVDMALYAREDGLLEPRAQKAVDWVKEQSRKSNFIIADISSNPRTALQNRYLNGWIYAKQAVPKLNEAGYLVGNYPWTRNSFHAAMQEVFLIVEEFLLWGKHHKIYESTADMSKQRFSEYIQQVTEFTYGQWGIHIEDPREGYWLEVMKELSK